MPLASSYPIRSLRKLLGVDSSNNVGLSSKVDIAPGTPFEVIATNSAFNESGDGNSPTVVNITHGKNSSLVTDDNPTVSISRTEAKSGDGGGGQGAALQVCLRSTGSNATSGPFGQGNAIYASAVQSGYGDCCGVISAAFNASPNATGVAAYSYYAGTVCEGAVGNGAVNLGTGLSNNTGTDASFVSSPPYIISGLDMVSQGSNLCQTVMDVRNGGAQFDVVIGMYPGSVKTAIIKNYSDCVNGVDLTGAVYTGAPILAPLMTPASSSATGTIGSIKWDTGFIYICTATNTWKRAALSTF